MALLTTVVLCMLCLSSGTLFSETNQSPNPFKENYLSAIVLRHDPSIHTEKHFRSGKITSGLGIRHNLDVNWMMGINLHFKSFMRRDRDEELAFFTATHEALGIFRLYHPTYLLIGPSILYMIPTERSRFALVRAPDVETEIGVGINAEIVTVIKPAFLLALRVERWRGTKTNRYHGISTSLQLSVALR